MTPFAPNSRRVRAAYRPRLRMVGVCAGVGLGRNGSRPIFRRVAGNAEFRSSAPIWRKLVGVEPTSDAERRSLVLKTRPCTGRI